MSQYFPKSFPEPFDGDINLKVNLSNYTTKADIKNILHVDAWRFALKSNLACSKNEVDKLEIDKLVLVPVDLSKTILLKKLPMINYLLYWYQLICFKN